MSTFILSVVQKNPFPKLKLYFEYVDKANFSFGKGFFCTTDVYKRQS